ncbi:homoserine dehydrogenase [Halogeometricum borinquense DSM 11551]|uniref:homoserine dehydrogenase n=1 Tax=Halogeometricum borinquense (strain ATCC 700274 / DSM 11551 / JCM 10706 / KCTC 4070 / PR3) TaxID=469382 RepID=E4NLA6_HALBP|nr:homoserine dehydrogenase [Halogeometricum borinquense]ADQ68355.1 homoserine dehydrogenase [Halogeometricum borinquense DSM 11551]ELY31318.1 homoserine dehydrogenase [Halogeometricum borinquense DSM 11551]
MSGKRLAVLGAGAVGGSVVELAESYGHTVTAFADSASAVVDADGIDPASVLKQKHDEGRVGSADPESALHADYDVLVEATPTTLGDAEPGFSHVRHALERGADVVLANKGPVAERYADLMALERENAGSVRFEATVGGAIPVLSTIEDLSPEHVTAARGVLNGTANFVLSRMATEGLDYEHVLAEAQDLGVAEADPSFDVEGTDAALKCVILSNVLAEGEREYTLADANVEGITNIPGSALELAAEDGQTVRLIGESTPDRVRVSPRLVPQNTALAVSGTRNIVQLETKHAGQLNISGRGAGGPETASAVLADIGRLD